MENKYSKTISTKTKFQGKWLQYEELSYKDKSGKTRSWEFVKRTADRGAVMIIAKLVPSNQVIIIKQYRPPVEKYIYEFPAGLIDEGETAESTAIRELKEETGYTGSIKHLTFPVFNTPGLTNETVNIAFVEVDETLETNITPVPEMESTEDIEVVLVNDSELFDFLMKEKNNGVEVDAKLMTYSILCYGK